VWRSALLAIGVVGAALLVLAASHGGAATPRQHSCGPGDHQFIQAAALTKGQLWLWQQETSGGETTPIQLVAESRDAVKQVTATFPTDPALREARLLMAGMFEDYRRAVEAKAAGDPRSTALFLRAFTLSNYSREVLTAALAPLGALGCNVAPLVA